MMENRDFTLRFWDRINRTSSEWVNLVFSSGLSAGIKAAQAANDPALLDAFHATLTGELHEQLVAQKKLDNL